jgi:hypothetical protein
MRPMSPTDITIVHAAAVHSVRVNRGAAHAFSLPTVREIPPAPRPGTFSSTW